MSEERLKEIIKKLVKEIEEEELEIDEITTTSDVAGYQTPYAFKDSDGKDDEDETDDAFVDRINTSTGYKRVTENRWHELRKSEGTPNQKIGIGIREMRKQLQEMDKFITWYSRIKNENNMEGSQYWKRTNRHLNAIRERLNKISKKIYDLSA